ncbi:hypothetical protein C8R42DRAFT_685610 [Lentinula raphanica]|nr:hypothetical protein C8R42DRAFT_685610 [Lentinula raphanica]
MSRCSPMKVFRSLVMEQGSLRVSSGMGSAKCTTNWAVRSISLLVLGVTCLFVGVFGFTCVGLFDTRFAYVSAAQLGLSLPAVLIPSARSISFSLAVSVFLASAKDSVSFDIAWVTLSVVPRPLTPIWASRSTSSSPEDPICSSKFEGKLPSRMALLRSLTSWSIPKKMDAVRIARSSRAGCGGMY